MGCDIHWYSETRHKGKWECDQASTMKKETLEDKIYSEMQYFPGRGRDYWLFGLLAEVCTQWDWSISAKGFPEDASPEVQQVYTQWEDGVHTPSYLNRTELQALKDTMATACTQALIDPNADDETRVVASYLAARVQEILNTLKADVPPEDQRVVFWFDN